MVKVTPVSYNIHSESRCKNSNVCFERYSKSDAKSRSVNGEHVEQVAAFDVIPALQAGHGLSWVECVFEIFFSIQGPFFFILPHAFKQLGYVPSIVGTITISLLYAHILHTYLWCEREIKRRRTMPDDADISLEAMIDFVFNESSSPIKKRMAGYLKTYWKYEIILSWSLSVSLSELFISQNIQFTLGTHGYSVSVDKVLLALFPLTTLIAYIPNLKVMSTVAFLTTAVFILIMSFIMYTILVETGPLPPITPVGDLYAFPTFVATIMLTINFTPLIFQLKQEVKRRKDLEGTFGCVNVTMFVLIVLNVCFSLFAYLRYGDDTRDNILENLPRTTIMTLANVILTAALMCCNSISFFVVFQTVWCGGLRNCLAKSRNVRLYEYFARTLTNLFVTSMAILVPTLEIFINLTSSFSCPFDSVLLPIFLRLMLISAEGKKDKRFYLTLIEACIFLVLSVAFSITCFCKFLTDITAYYS